MISTKEAKKLTLNEFILYFERLKTEFSQLNFVQVSLYVDVYREQEEIYNRYKTLVTTKIN